MNGTIEQKSSCSPVCPPRAEWSDEELLLEYRWAGERKAFEELVSRYERELYSYLRHYLGDDQMAEDAFQATFLQVHLKCDQFEPGRKVRPWLYTVATNLAIDAQRRNRRHRMVSLDRQTDGRSGEQTNLAQWLGGPSSNPEAEMEHSEACQDVRRAVDRLPEPLKQVVILVYYQGLKYREVAQVLSIPLGTVKSRLHAAIRKLESYLNTTRPIGHG